MGKKKSGESIISRGIATGLRIIGIQSEKDKVFERCATVIEGRCMCASPYPYRRLSVEKHNKPVKMTFYKHEYRDEGSYTMEVDRKICALDLCQILAEKMQFGSMTFWSLVEFWVDKRAERVLEEHEIVVEVYKEMLKFKRRARVRYVMRQVITKFDFLIEPTKMRHEGGIICEDPELYENFHLICFIEKLIDENKCPAFFSRTIMLYKKGWKMAFILLKDETLYYTDDHNGKMKLIQLTEMCARIDLHDIPGLVEIGPVANLQIYRVIKSGTPLVESKESNAFLLRPVATPTVRAREETDAPKSSARIPVLPKGVIRCTSLSQNFATTWIALMRLAKYGKQLRENYRAFKNKNEAPTREFSRANVPNTSDTGNETQPPILERESVRSRVAMDFTGKQGRIVEDPVEANEIALAEGYMWKRRHKIPTRRTVNSKLSENHVDVGIHTMQPWFHTNLSRDQASSLVTRYGEGDGVFIVRPSRTSEGTYVLTYKCQGKLAHQQIVPMIDKERNITVFTLDNGQTKFYDILQLVEFYTVNLGPLMCRLTHYITENANIQNPNVPSPSNTPKYVNVAVNTEISIHSTEQQNLLESPSGSSKTTSSHSLSSR